MFALRGKKLIEAVLQHIPEDIERLMQKRHTKWCDDARLVPWSAGEEIGATLRVSPRFSQETYAISWGAALNESSTVELFLYEGDVAHLYYEAADGGGLDEERKAARDEIRNLADKRTKCKDGKDLVSKLIQKIQDAVVAHKMLGVA